MIVQKSNIYALPIRVDCYMPNCLPDGSYYVNLGGCVGDIGRVKTFLKNIQKVPELQILTLTATSSQEDATKPVESPDKLPTRNNLINSFRKLGKVAPAGLQVYVHYSGLFRAFGEGWSGV